jgi:hypothetical protein
MVSWCPFQGMDFVKKICSAGVFQDRNKILKKPDG